MWPNPQFPADLVTFTEEILNGDFIFCAVTKVEQIFKVEHLRTNFFLYTVRVYVPDRVWNKVLSHFKIIKGQGH